MHVDKIYKNARIFMADADMPEASSFAIKDGTFVYVGNEAGLAGFEGEVCDLAGKFAMPAVMDSHIHIPVCIIGASSGTSTFIRCSNKDGGAAKLPEAISAIIAYKISEREADRNGANDG